MTGDGNTASGVDALVFNSVGTQNSAFGFDALTTNDSGGQNAAVGYQALTNSTVSGNTAVGWQALSSDSTGSSNTAVGSSALAFNQTGTTDVAVGYGALYRNTASSNTAAGWQSLNANTTGAGNTASGTSALQSNTTGDNNIAEGYQAGFNQTTGSNNIDIGSVGVAGESNVIRIGTKGTHKVTVIAGINSSKVTGSAVYVTTTGRLGVLASSERFKTSIAPIGDSTEKLQQLRPVSFHLKAEPKGAVQYGLIAEEVAKVYPELVIRDEKGRIDGVRYDELAPMLLNEVQQQQQKIDAQVKINEIQQARIRDLELKFAKLQTALTKAEPESELVAQR
jgi:Chaperone of endosialidase